MKSIQRLTDFLTHHPAYGYGLVFTAALLLFTALHLDLTFADPDSFYHAKLALLLRDDGILYQFPWLSVTALAKEYVDHHFLYHVALIPFVTWFSPLIGLKLATIFFASLAITALYWLLRQLHIKHAWAYALFLLTINPFIFRLGLAKAQGLVLTFFFLSLGLVFARRALPLLALSFLYVWLYAGWPLVIGLTLLFIGLTSVFSRESIGLWALRRPRSRVVYHNALLVLCVVVGTVAGALFSPYFPQILAFSWVQAFKIGIVNYQNVIGVGGEWYPYGAAELFFQAIPFFFLLFVSAVVAAVTCKKQPVVSWALLLFTVLFCALTFKSRRYVEYFVPVAVAFCACALNAGYPVLARRYARFNPARLVLIGVLGVLVGASPIIARDVLAVRDSYADGIPFTRYAEAAQWLADSTAEGEVVLHSDWDEFPVLFFHNSHNYYIVGLDPTFMYTADPVRYQLWVDITTGKKTSGLGEAVKEFGSRYVFVDADHTAMASAFAVDPAFRRVFEGSDGSIYQLR